MGHVLRSAPAIGFLPSTDLERSRVFFVEALGLSVTEVNPFAVVLATGSAMLRLTKVEQLDPQPFTVFGWQVEDIGWTMERLAAKGVRFLRFDGLEQDERGVWHTPDGSCVAWFHDPDGNTLSLTQFADY